MDFRNFLRSYTQTVYAVEKTEGSWQGGVWVPGEEVEEPFQAAVMPISDDLLVFGEAGMYTEHDRRVFTYHKLNQGQKIKIDGELYTVAAKKDFSHYAAGLRVYVVRREGDADD